jgi:hypothetical protein
MRARHRISITVAGLSGLAFLAINNPIDVDFLPSCQFLAITGFECPGCGATRCVHALLNGNFLDAVDYNVLTVVAAPFVVWRYGQWLWGRGLDLPPVKYRWIVTFGFIVLGFGILRNVSYEPFLVLAASQNR